MLNVFVNIDIVLSTEETCLRFRTIINIVLTPTRIKCSGIALSFNERDG